MKNDMSIKRFWLFWEKYGVFLIFLLVAGIFAAIDSRVIELSQLMSVLTRSSWVAVGAAGMTFAICSGGLDLSVAGVMSLSGSLLAKLIMDNGLSTGAAVLLTLAAAVCCGLVNGVLITKLKIQPFVATLATNLIFDGITQVYTGNVGTFIKTEQYAQLSVLGRGMVAGIPIKVLVMVLVYILAIMIYRNMTFGVKVRAVGSNEVAARTSGIKADRTLMGVYVFTAVTAALGAILYISTVQSASPDAGDGFDLDCITAVVLGGTALSGGKGNLLGTLIGAILVSFVKMCLNFLSAPEAMHVIVTGLVLLLALSISGVREITQKEKK